MKMSKILIVIFISALVCNVQAMDKAAGRVATKKLFRMLRSSRAPVKQVQKLIAAGANVQAKDEFCMIPLHFAVLVNPNPEIVDTLVDSVRDMREDPLAYVNTKSVDRRSSLHWAVDRNVSPAVAEALIGVVMERGGSVKAFLLAKDKDGHTPLHVAAMSNGNSRVMKMLLDIFFVSGGDMLYYLTSIDKNGKTPLLLAAENNPNALTIMPVLVQAVRECGGDGDVEDYIFAVDNSGCTALDLMKQNERLRGEDRIRIMRSITK